MAAVEFALIMPLMLLVFLAATDLTRALGADRKINQVAATLGDLVSRDAIDENYVIISDYFAVSEAIMIPFDHDVTAMRMSIVEVAQDGTTTVLASQAINGMDRLPVGEPIDLDDNFAALAQGDCAILTEARYSFRPLFDVVFRTEVPLSHRAWNLPRTGESCSAPALYCAGYSHENGNGYNCNTRHNSWGNGRGAGGGITNNGS